MLVIPATSAGFGTEWPAAFGLAATILVGALIGFCNGFMIVRMKLNAFIVTLAMLIVLRGLHVGLTEGQTLWDMPGILAAVAGLVLTGYVGAVSASQCEGMIFTVFAAAVIGGISLKGGRGSIIGALTGVLLLGIVQNILTLAEVPWFCIQAIYGVIVLGSLMVARLTNPNSQ